MLMTRQKAADYLCVSTQTLHRWTSGAPYLPHIRIGGSIRYRKKDLEAFLDGHVTIKSNEVPA